MLRWGLGSGEGAQAFTSDPFHPRERLYSVQALDNEAGNDLDIISPTALSCPFTEDESSSESLSDLPKVTQPLVARPGSEPKDLDTWARATWISC